MSSEEKLASIESDVAGIRNSLVRGNRISTVISVILLLLMLGYFVYGYREISSVLKPDIVVDLGQTMVDDNIPMVKQTIRTEVENNAPVWAKSLSDQAVASVPDIRKSLVSYTVNQTADVVEQSVNVSQSSFDDFVETHRADIQKAIDELKNNEEVSAELLEVIEGGFNDALEADLKRDSQEVLAYAGLMKNKMDRMVANEDLDEAERLERQALMILRRLQLSELKE